jgi:hypothetical protein
VTYTCSITLQFVIENIIGNDVRKVFRRCMGIFMQSRGEQAVELEEVICGAVKLV